MASITIGVGELPGRLTEAIELARNGTEVVVSDATGPVAKLVPAAPPRREFILGMHPGALVMREDFCDPIDDEDFLRGDI